MGIVKKIFAKPYLAILRSKTRYKYIPLLGALISYSEKEGMLDRAFSFVDFNDVEGDYLEFGVWKARTFKAAYHLSRKYPSLKRMHFYGFDSFEGLPDISDTDSGVGSFQKGAYSFGLPEVKESVRRNGVDLKKTTFIKGWFKDTLNEETGNKLPLKKASVVYIDSDLYESAVSVLDFITPYVEEGTVLMFDDWFVFKGNPNKGEQRAFREWLEKNPNIKATQYRKFGWAGNSFILHV